MVELATWVVVKAAVAYVSPNGIVNVVATVPIVGSDEKRETVTSPSGSLAGFP